MTPRRAAGLVLRWVRFYTRRLPGPVAERRVGELDADLHDHIAYQRAAGVGDRRIALSVLSRLVRGLPADAVWRGRIRPWRKDLMRSLAAVLIVAVAVAALGVATMMYAQSDDAPGLGLIGILLIVGAIVFAVRALRRRGRLGAGRS